MNSTVAQTKIKTASDFVDEAKASGEDAVILENWCGNYRPYRAWAVHGGRAKHTGGCPTKDGARKRGRALLADMIEGRA